MRYLLMPVAVLSLVASFVGAAIAAPDEDAFALFERGAFELAAKRAVVQAETQPVSTVSAENYALAARALNAAAYLEDNDRVARMIAKRALNDAQQASDIDPLLVEAHLQLAIALAQRGARIAPWRAFLMKLAPRARVSLDRALALDSANAWALSSSAAWHLEVSRRAGEGRFGSDPELGFEQCLAAHEADPENLVIAYECALRLIAYDHSYARETWRREGLLLLEEAVGGSPVAAFEVAMHERAMLFHRAILEGEAKELSFIKAQP